jgi:hypothetical protein
LTAGDNTRRVKEFGHDSTYSRSVRFGLRPYDDYVSRHVLARGRGAVQ